MPVAAPEIMVSAAMDLSNIGSALTAAKAAAAAPTTGVLAAAEDEVSPARGETRLRCVVLGSLS